MSESLKKQGIHAYQKTLHGQTAEEMVKLHAPLVKRIALHLLSRLPKSVQLEDLIQAGMIGLLDAGQRYDPNQAASFETFVGVRIRGAMLDELRRNDWAPRSTHHNIRKITEAIQAVEKRNLKPASAQDIADELQISLNDYYEMLDNVSANEWVCLDEVTEDKFLERIDTNPENEVVEENLKHQLVQQLQSLPEREQLILSLYYNDEFNFKEIGKILELTEARVCQLHSQAVARLAARLKRMS